MIAVVDTSALVRLTTLRPRDVDDGLLTRLQEVTPHAPDLVDAEYLHALRGLALGRKLSTSRAELARALFAEIPLVRMPSMILADRIWALRYNAGAYDASFMALAEAFDAPLITCDRKQVRVSGHRAAVESF